MISLYKKFERLVIENGELICEVPSLLSPKKLYKIKDYLVMIDTIPLRDEDIIVFVKKEGEDTKFLYVSDNITTAFLIAFNIIPTEKEIRELQLSKIKRLEEIYNELRAYVEGKEE